MMTGEARPGSSAPQLSVVDVLDDGSPGFNKPRLAGWAVVTSGQPPSLT